MSDHFKSTLVALATAAFAMTAGCGGSNETSSCQHHGSAGGEATCQGGCGGQGGCCAAMQNGEGNCGAAGAAADGTAPSDGASCPMHPEGRCTCRHPASSGATSPEPATP